MNTNKLYLRGIALVFLLFVSMCCFQCEEGRPASDTPMDQEPTVPREMEVSTYRLFNLELAVEEAQHRQNRERRTSRSKVESAVEVALKQLRDPCNFNCKPDDFKCIVRYVECDQAIALVNLSDSDADDGDGAEPLPIASDTILMAYTSNLSIVIYSDEPDETRFELLTDDGQVYAVNDPSPDRFRYDEEERQMVYGIKVKNPELAGKPLTILMKTRIVNAEGKTRKIEIRHPFGLTFVR